jgi:uncharacterized membrane protein YphA (DoxX/SURF4 family)
MSEYTLDVFAYALQLTAGCVFLAAVAAKGSDMRAFREAVQSYDLLPGRLVSTTAHSIVVLEVLVTAAMITGVFVRPAAGVGLGLLVLFGAGISINLRRGRRVPCGCFGSRSEALSTHSLARIGFLAVPLTLLLRVESSSPSVWILEHGDSGSWHRLVDAGAVAAFLLIASAWLLALPQLFAIFHIRLSRSFSRKAHDPA